MVGVTVYVGVTDLVGVTVYVGVGVTMLPATSQLTIGFTEQTVAPL